MPEVPVSFVAQWRHLLLTHQDARSGDAPNYHDPRSIDSLVTSSVPRSLYVGTGHSIFSRAILPAIVAARRSVHFVTCFWAASPSLDGVREALVQLAASRSRQGGPLPSLHVTIGFSSWGLFQKLFHTPSLDGRVYPPREWAKLGLPDEESLRRGGIELTVKSLFFTPFSVLHPKYVIVDEARAWIPSCNVSWERWFEGCVELDGDVVNGLLSFHARVWGAHVGAGVNSEGGLELGDRRGVEAQDADVQDLDETSSLSPLNAEEEQEEGDQSATQLIHFAGMTPTPTILLPSPHHRNPRFRFFPFLSQSDPPMTPLNAALLTLFANARHEIHLVTPNVTSGPVLEALLAALSRGVNVQIRTSKNMMLIEQLVTAGTITSWCLKKLIKRYRRLVDRPQQPSDLEAQPVHPGKLEIFYYKQLRGRMGKEDEPVMSHFKMTMVDGEYLVLGSGNMDRASWWTSQELGVLFYMPGFQERDIWERVLERRAEVMFRSSYD